jgi:uncharacterized repeat protein (TIGR03803 family)
MYMHRLRRRFRNLIKSANVLMGILLGVVVLPIASGQNLTVLHNFQGSPADGNSPCSGVALNAGGEMYGTTQVGGASDYGTVFELDATGAETVIYQFVGGDSGAHPCAPLALAASGTIYGSTGFSESAYGTIFRMRGGNIDASYGFPGGSLGAFPSGVTLGDDGFLYGITGQGGAGQCGGCGTIYRIDGSGHETVLHMFNGPDGAYPSAPLIQDTEGNLYGTTVAGGLNNSLKLCPNGCGTVFKLTRSGTFTCLHKFTGGTSDGWYVPSGVVLDANGNLFGTTAGGGTWNDGVIYEITTAGEEKILYNFAGEPDGQNPNGLTISAGKLYGTTLLGGTAGDLCYTGGCGTIFEFDESQRETVLYRFSGITDGDEPTGTVSFDHEGNMYGTTTSGPENGCSFSHGGCGTIWKLTP